MQSLCGRIVECTEEPDGSSRELWTVCPDVIKRNSLVEIQAHSTKYSTIIWVASAMESLLPYIPNHFSLTPMERHKYREEWEGQLMMI